MIAKPNAKVSIASSAGCYGSAGRLDTDTEIAAECGRRKILLPPRPGQSKFAPPQYYYPASRSGVVPSATLAA
jgi:hypothetical protein